MAITAKCQWIFNFEKRGWSETWYLTKPSINDCLTTMAFVAESRVAMLGKFNTLEAIRCSDVAILGDSIISGSDELDAINLDNTGLAPDTVTNVIQCRADAGTLYRRTVDLRGLPDEWVAYSLATGDEIYAPLFLTRFNLFAANVIGEGFQIRVISKNDADVNKVNIVGISVEAVTGRALITADAAGIFQGQEVRISGLKDPGLKRYNGIWVVTSSAGNTFAIPTPGPLSNFLPTDKAIARRRRIVYVNVTSLEIQRYASRDTGRAFFVPRGRRKAAR